MRTFDLIRDAVLPDFRERVADYLIQYESVLLSSTEPGAGAQAGHGQSIARLSARAEHDAGIGHGGLGRVGSAGGGYVALAPGWMRPVHQPLHPRGILVIDHPIAVRR